MRDKSITVYFVFLQSTDDNANPRIMSSRSRSSDEPHIGKYRLIKTIGKGNFAKVKLAKHVPTGREVMSLCAVKPAGLGVEGSLLFQHH